MDRVSQKPRLPAFFTACINLHRGEPFKVHSARCDQIFIMRINPLFPCPEYSNSSNYDERALKAKIY